MNELQIIEQNGQLLIDSRDVAEMTDVRHSDLLEKVDGYVKHLTNGKFRSSDFFIESTYQDAKNETRKCYLITRKGCDMVANKMTGEKGVLFTATYVTRFEEMEKQIALSVVPSYMIDNPIKRAEKWIEEYREKEVMQKQIEAQKPLVGFAETLLASENSVLVRELAKVASKHGIVIGERRLYQKLREWGLIMKGSTEPMQRYIDAGYFEVTQGGKETSTGNIIFRTTRVTPKGQMYIINRLKQEFLGAAV